MRQQKTEIRQAEAIVETTDRPVIVIIHSCLKNDLSLQQR